jgi:phosphohistidine phosphatase
MRLLVIRHGKAIERDRFAATGQDDSERPLTRKGRERMIEASRGLRILLPEISLIATSPLVRAEQTARIIAEAYPGVVLVERDELAPEAETESLLHWLKQQHEKVIAVVGHEPNLSELIGEMVKSGEETIDDLKKGAMCLIEFAGRCDRGAGKLIWQKSAKQLAKNS